MWMYYRIFIQFNWFLFFQLEKQIGNSIFYPAQENLIDWKTNQYFSKKCKIAFDISKSINSETKVNIDNW